MYDSRGARLQMEKVEQAYPKMERSPSTVDDETPDTKKPISRRSKGSPKIVDRYATLKLHLVLMIARRLLECGPDAVKTSIDGAFVHSSGGWRGGAPPQHSTADDVAASGRRSRK